MARTIPAAFLTGLSSGYRLFHLVKIEGAASTLYWTTAGTNLAGSTLVLTATAGSASLTYDSSMIAFKQMGPGGQEEMVDGIGAMEASVDIVGGGAVASVSDVDIEILNQARYDETIISAANHLENRPITIYLGFIPSGTTPTVVIADDMMARWTGIIEDTFDLDHSRMFLRCVDSVLLRHKDLPTVLIEDETFPDAPKENFGQPLPILYGTWQESDIDVARDFGRLSLPPAVKTNDITNEFYIADHEINTLGDPYVWVDLWGYGKILTAPTTSNTSGGAKFDWADTAVSTALVATFRLQPKIISAPDMADATDVVDDDETSYGSVDWSSFPTKFFEAQLPRPQDIGVLTSSTGSGSPELNFYVRFGTITTATTARAEYNIGAGQVSAGTFSTADADTRKAFNFTIANLTWEQLGDMSVRLGNSGAADLDCQVKNWTTEIHIKVSEILARPVRRGFK